MSTTPAFDWDRLLHDWEQRVLAWNDKVAVIYRKPTGLRFPEASRGRIVECENRLGVQLPPSFKEFLSTSDGWLLIGSDPEKTINFSTSAIAWLRDSERERECVDDWLGGVGEEVFDPDEKYLVYGSNQDTLSIRTAYFQSLLVIGNCHYRSDFYALNPEITTADGEWEAWYFTTHQGTWRYRSFKELMIAEREHDLAEYEDVSKMGL